MKRSDIPAGDKEQKIIDILKAYRSLNPYIFSVYRGREGVDLAAAVKPGLILPEIRFSVMDGYATGRELRKNPGLAEAPVIALTSYATTGDREKAPAAGCTGYIEKPINPKNFIEQIE